jgi:hypothetical protein
MVSGNWGVLGINFSNSGKSHLSTKIKFLRKTNIPKSSRQKSKNIFIAIYWEKPKRK